MAVETIVDTRLDNQLDDERAACNDAITKAVNASTTAIIAHRKGKIDAAMTAEAAQRSTETQAKIGEAATRELAGLQSWVPVMRVVTRGAKKILHVSDWSGGTGRKPGTGYIGQNGIATSAAQAADIRGAV